MFSFEPSGNMAMPSDEELAQADLVNSILVYSNGARDDGLPYYAFIAVRPSKYREFQDLSEQRQSFLLSEYGTVLAMGMEAEAPPEVIQEMRERYGFDPEYKEKLLLEARRQQDSFLTKKEEQRIGDIVTMLKRKNCASPNNKDRECDGG